jgi:hypothetical protein
MPYSVLTDKFERYEDLPEDRNQVHNYNLNILKDFGPEETFLESDAPAKRRGDNYGILNMRYNGSGTRGNLSEPNHSEMNFSIFGKDPRGTNVDPDMSKLRDMTFAREKWIRMNMHPDGARASPEGARTDNEIIRAKNQMFYIRKKYLQNFDNQEIQAISSQSKHVDLKSVLESQQPDTYFEQNDPNLRCSSRIALSGHPISSVFARALTDQNFKVPLYGAKVYSKDAKLMAGDGIKAKHKTRPDAILKESKADLNNRKTAIMNNINSIVNKAVQSIKHGESKNAAIHKALLENKGIFSELLKLQQDAKSPRPSKDALMFSGLYQTTDPLLHGQQMSDEKKKKLFQSAVNAYMAGLHAGEDNCLLNRRIEREIKRVVVDEKEMSIKKMMLFDPFAPTKQRKLSKIQKLTGEHKTVMNYRRLAKEVQKAGGDTMSDGFYGTEDKVTRGKNMKEYMKPLQADYISASSYDGRKQDLDANMSIGRRTGAMGTKYLRRNQETMKDVGERFIAP